MTTASFEDLDRSFECKKKDIQYGLETSTVRHFDALNTFSLCTATASGNKGFYLISMSYMCIKDEIIEWSGTQRVICMWALRHCRPLLHNSGSITCMLHNRRAFAAAAALLFQWRRGTAAQTRVHSRKQKHPARDTYCIVNLSSSFVQQLHVQTGESASFHAEALPWLQPSGCDEWTSGSQTKLGEKDADCLFWQGKLPM